MNPSRVLRRWEITTCTRRVIDTAPDYIAAVELAMFHADRDPGRGVWVVHRDASWDSAEHIAATVHT